jgi:hypothetical protein
VNEAELSTAVSRPPAYDWLRETVAADLERERARGHQVLSWLVGGELLMLGLYGFCLQQLAGISAQEPATYPKENIPVSSLAWFTAWALPLLGLCFAALMMWSLAASLFRAQSLLRHWRQSEGLAASSGQRMSGALYPPLRGGGGWSLLAVPMVFLALWVVVIRTQSAAIESGIENWRSIPQDQA